VFSSTSRSRRLDIATPCNEREESLRAESTNRSGLHTHPAASDRATVPRPRQRDRKSQDITTQMCGTCGPELNSIENLGHYLKSRYWLNRVHADYEALKAAAIEAWRHAVLGPKLMIALCAATYLKRANTRKDEESASGSRPRQRFILPPLFVAERLDGVQL